MQGKRSAEDANAPSALYVRNCGANSDVVSMLSSGICTLRAFSDTTNQGCSWVRRATRNSTDPTYSVQNRPFPPARVTLICILGRIMRACISKLAQVPLRVSIESEKSAPFSHFLPAFFLWQTPCLRWCVCYVTKPLRSLAKALVNDELRPSTGEGREVDERNKTARWWVPDWVGSRRTILPRRSSQPASGFLKRHL